MGLGVLEVLVLLGVGVISGAMNTFAGAGGALAIPVLAHLLGNPVLALATFRVGVVAQSAIGLDGFLFVDRQPVIAWSSLLTVLTVGVAGGLVGAALAAATNPQWYGWLVVGSLGVIVGLLARGWWQGRASARAGAGALAGASAAVPPAWPQGLQLGALLVASTYGGFMHVGISFILLAVLQRGFALSTVAALGVRSAIMLVLNAVALIWMGLAGMVAWRHGAILAVGSTLGAILAVRLAVAQRERTLQTIVLAMASLALIAAVVGLVTSSR